MSDAQYRNDDQKSPEQLEREVRMAREELGGTVDALGNRLSPGELLDQALGYAREHGGEFGRNLGAQVQANPLPLLLTGVGLSWLILGSRGGARGGAGSAYTVPSHRASSAASAAKGRIGDAAAGVGAAGSRVKESVAQAGSSIGETLDESRARIGEGLAHTRASAQQMLHEQPLAVGALGVALGAVLGALLPVSRREHQALGPVKERVASEVAPKVEEQYERLRESAKETADDVKSAIVGEGNGAGRHPGSTPASDTRRA